MPELPEVETIKRGLEKTALKKEINNVLVFDSCSLKNSPEKFINSIKGNAFTDLERRGKFLFFQLKGDKCMIAHMGMTGQLVWKKHKEVNSKHTRVAVCFNDGSVLYFNDIRKFGFLQIADEIEKNAILTERLGLDAWKDKIKTSALKNIFKKKNTPVKVALLDQKNIAGIGNIYADEVCFDADIMPSRIATSLSDDEIKNLTKSIKKILKNSIKCRGTSFSDYVDGEGRRGNFVKYLKVYGREGERCLKCGSGNIKKIKLAGRGTHFCPKCQK